MDAVRIASDALIEGLKKTLELLHALTELSFEKQAYIESGDIERLRAAAEREEELTAELFELEKDREIHAGAFLEAIGVFNSGQSLAGLIEATSDAGLRQRLGTLKDELGNALNTLTAQNDKLRQLLALQINYTEYMLNLIFLPESKSHTYDVLGSRRDDSNELSLLDYRI